ncbi:hypothetical protein BABINDRAFT_35483 [Babjeviella inositovora NRRL Y-12698]|uniref:Signal peptidase subunit 3 n=1 Tax=Babjeviella inositovora NRRL Y-12698 TaxID=984486 RepID=A0A1E3QRR3_9ASCO|nr:uncharacterized protein BABINDRAFT_35483 [Babjeviella inositovora NRRL Y-12698]ODQ80328.1 hypothetical protein BABINDRAFT_35483 [Babjeviella inositovora NRRL Y-12698]
MFSLLQRGQQVSNQAISALSYIAFAIIALFLAQLHFDNAYNLPSQIANIETSTNIRYSYSAGSTSAKGKENSKIKFDIDTDLSSLFNWNTKQVFVYLTATYPGKSPESSNRVTYWDKIITDPKDAKLSLKSVRGKYSVYDREFSFRERNATLALEWNIQPWIGPLVFGTLEGGQGFSFSKPEKPRK